ncbi:hypothetical protein V502_00940 [Pseudogymnoascus sp. VKM F-4520 (FW-2644)]|nr:hypothetical protein V502_00940 [Pseudogymnoascus sp. VKM F-4520 (FW-2644)]
MAAASALDLVVLEVLELRPLGQERLAARVTQSAAVVAEWALVAEAAGGPAVLDGGRSGDGARSVSTCLSIPHHRDIYRLGEKG